MGFMERFSGKKLLNELNRREKHMWCEEERWKRRESEENNFWYPTKSAVSLLYTLMTHFTSRESFNLI